MISTHVYAAVLLGTPDVPLSVRGGRVTLDESAAPHVQGTLTLAIPDMSTLDGLDPRRTPRVRVDVTSTSLAWPTVRSRSFDLGIRDRRIALERGEVTLELASDEALMSDYAPLADDATPFTYQASLRDVIDYVLGESVPGAALEPGTTNADVTTYESVVNLVANPAAIVDLAGWSAVNLGNFLRQTGATWAANTAATAFRLYGNPANVASYISLTPANLSGLAGRTIMVRARLRNGGTNWTGMTRDTNYLRMTVYASTNGGIGYNKLAESAPGALTANAQSDQYLTVTIPHDVNSLGIRLHHGILNGDSAYWTDVRVSEFTGDPTDRAYFDGSTVTTSVYRYSWSGTTGASQSHRVALVDRPADSLLWRAGRNALAFLAPIVQAAGFRLVCDEDRRWTLRGEDYTDPGPVVTVRYGTNLMAADDVVSRDAGIWCDAAVTVYTWIGSLGETLTRFDAFALNDPYTRLVTFERAAPYPGPGFSAYAVRRAQGRGHDLTVTLVADWRTRAEQVVSITLPDIAPLQTGQVSRVVFDLDRDEMTVTTRTTDTPPLAWVLGPDDLVWNAVTPALVWNAVTSWEDL